MVSSGDHVPVTAVSVSPTAGDVLSIVGVGRTVKVPALTVLVAALVRDKTSNPGLVAVTTTEMRAPESAPTRRYSESVAPLMLLVTPLTVRFHWKVKSSGSTDGLHVPVDAVRVRPT